MRSPAALLLLGSLPAAALADTAPPQVVHRHLCEDAVDLRPFMAARSSEIVRASGGDSPHALRIACDFRGGQPLSVLWDLPPLRTDGVAVRVRMPQRGRLDRPGCARSGGRPAPDPARGRGHARPRRLVPLRGPRGRRPHPRGAGRGRDANLVVARPDGTGPQPIYTSLTVRLTPAPGSALAAGEGPAEVDDLRLYRDDTGSWE